MADFAAVKHALDEVELLARLTPLVQARKAAFAVACAQRLLPLYERYANSRPGISASPVVEAVEATWSAVAGADIELEPHRVLVEALVPDEDDDRSPDAAYAENAAAAVAYAIRTWLCDAPQEAVWAARQLYEAADLASQQAMAAAGTPRHGPYPDTREHQLVQAVLATLQEDLKYVEQDHADFSVLAARAVREGQS